MPQGQPARLARVAANGVPDAWFRPLAGRLRGPVWPINVWRFGENWACECTAFWRIRAINVRNFGGTTVYNVRHFGGFGGRNVRRFGGNNVVNVRQFSSIGFGSSSEQERMVCRAFEVW